MAAVYFSSARLQLLVMTVRLLLVFGRRQFSGFITSSTTRPRHGGGWLRKDSAIRQYGPACQRYENIGFASSYYTYRSDNARAFVASRLYQSSPDNEQSQHQQRPMENLYQEWTLEDDQVLFENRKEPTVKLASMLGRGLRGVESRLSKLRDVNSAAYQRLFVENTTSKLDAGNEEEEISNKKKKLVPALEVLRRIRWDYGLSSKDFFILSYDRVEDTVIQSPFDHHDGTNRIDHVLEHRIVAIKYKEQIVWDRERRLDLVFNDELGGIRRVIEEYDGWKQQRDDAIALNLQRQEEVAMRLQKILGFEREERLMNLLKEFQTITSKDPRNSGKIEAERYVKQALELFQEVLSDPSETMPEWIPRSDYAALDVLSELVSLLPVPDTRDILLAEIDSTMKRVIGKKELDVVTPSISTVQKRPLPVIKENEITESFVRGTGPGGQKINKTSNRVVLIHQPTQIRVECQETRSLQQNRKIARRRLQEKLDDYLYGSESKASIKAKEASNKKAKAKSKAKARVKKLRQEQQNDQMDVITTTSDGFDDSDFDEKKS